MSWLSAEGRGRGRVGSAGVEVAAAGALVFCRVDDQLSKTREERQRLTNGVKLLLHDEAVVGEALAAYEGVLAIGRLIRRHTE